MLVGLQFPSFAFTQALNPQSVSCSQVIFIYFIFLVLHFLIMGHHILLKETNSKRIKNLSGRDKI